MQAPPPEEERLPAQLQRPSSQRLGGSKVAQRPHSSSKASSGSARRQHDRERRHGGRELQKRGALAPAPRTGTQSLTAMTALGTVALYTSVRGGITVFHHLRRRYLRQLLFDLAAALNDLGQCYWLDFGRWVLQGRRTVQCTRGGALQGQAGQQRPGVRARAAGALTLPPPLPRHTRTNSDPQEHTSPPCSLLGIHRDGDLILHDNDIDIAVLQPQWPVLLSTLRDALPQYSVRIVVPSDDPNTCFIRVYCPLGMADVFGATPVVGAAKGERLLVDWWVWGRGRGAMVVGASVHQPLPGALPDGRCGWHRAAAEAASADSGPTTLQRPRGVHRDHARQRAAHRAADLARRQDQRARRYPRRA